MGHMINSLYEDFISVGMSYTTWTYFVLVGICLLLYYILPMRIRWIVLLFGSGAFFSFAIPDDGMSLMFLLERPGFIIMTSEREVKISLFFLSIVLTYIGGLILQRSKNRIVFCIFLILSILPLTVVKIDAFSNGLFLDGMASAIVPLGLSFYSLQEYAYLYDVYKDKTDCQKNPLKLALFISFFPQILQGPIPRYAQLKEELYIGHRFDYDGFAKGFMLALWGFFLKFMIAERASVIVNAIFSDHRMYQGAFSLVAGILYSIQLYADFLACVCMSRGVAGMFGITLAENFMQPYLAVSIKDFWRRWHMSLSSWLRDYVYIPLGGSRRGNGRKYLNLVLTFLVSAIWHGSGIRFIVWGLLHAIYQILGDLLKPVKEFIKRIFGIKNGTMAQKTIARIMTFFLVMLGWIVFRADTLKTGIEMIKSIFTVYNPWIFFDDSLLRLGLDWKEWMLLIVSIYLLFRMEYMQQKVVVRDAIMRQPLIVRWILILSVMTIVIIFGKYGYGFNAADFIYGGF